MEIQTNASKRWVVSAVSLSQGSQCSECPTSVVASELWLRDDLEEVYALLFQFLGFGFRLAMSNVGWHVTQKFVILVPDPIAFAPRLAVLDSGEPCDICQHTFSGLVFVLVLHSHHKSIGGRSSSATSSRRRARRARPREARFVTLANLTRQSRAMVFA